MGNEKLITEKDVIELLEAGTKNLSISKDTIITPLALDMIAENSIEIEYRDGNDLKDLPAELLLKFYYLLLKIRLFEEIVKNYSQKNIIPGIMVHSYIGQEAVAVCVCSALESQDFLTSTHRGHGHLIAKGAEPGKMLAEILGKVD